jgi:hypothetical protein
MQDIRGYEGLYAITTDGKVWSYRKQKFLKNYTTEDGYLYVTLYKNKKRKTIKIHRLVAETFIANPNNLPEVNHKSEIKTDNRMENLEWITKRGNANYGTRTERIHQKTRKKVCCIETGVVYNSTVVAEDETGILGSHISEVANGIRKTAGGYSWRYIEEEIL